MRHIFVSNSQITQLSAGLPFLLIECIFPHGLTDRLLDVNLRFSQEFDLGFFFILLGLMSHAWALL